MRSTGGVETAEGLEQLFGSDVYTSTRYVTVPWIGDPIDAFADVLGVPTELVLGPPYVSDGMMAAQTQRRLRPLPTRHGVVYAVWTGIAAPAASELTLTEAKADPFQYVIEPADAEAEGALVVTPAAALAWSL